MVNINKWGVGVLSKATRADGTVVYRENSLWFMVGETVERVECVFDPDHFLYQHRMPISRKEYEEFKNTLGYIPADRLGENVMCTCGASGVMIIDPKAPIEWHNKLICRSQAEFGIHQTGMNRKDGKISLPDDIAQDKIMTEQEYLRKLRDENERL